MSFRTQYMDHPRLYQEPGSREKILYSPVFDRKGVMSLEESGIENLYDYIQSHAQSVDIHVLLQRYQQGDLTVLSRVQGTYGDFTQMPTTFAGALNTLIAAEQYFDSLPVDVRAKFGHSFSQFIASMDSADFARSMGIDVPDASTLTPTSASNIEDHTGPQSVPAPAPVPTPQTTSAPAT